MRIAYDLSIHALGPSCIGVLTVKSFDGKPLRWWIEASTSQIDPSHTFLQDDFSGQQRKGHHRVAYVVCLNDTRNGIPASLKLLDQRVRSVSAGLDFT